MLPISQQAVFAAVSATVLGATAMVAGSSNQAGGAGENRTESTQTLRLAAYGPVSHPSPGPSYGYAPQAALVEQPPAPLDPVQLASARTPGPATAKTHTPKTPATGAAPAPKAPVAGSSVGAGALAQAMTRIGKPYAWGAAGPNSFDCSGLVLWAFKQVGVNLPHSSSAQSTMGAAVSRDQLRPGDLVFFYSPVSHVGIYVGNGQVLNATESGQPVKISSMAYLPFHNARRL